MPYPVDITTLKLRKESLDNFMSSLNLNEKLKQKVEKVLANVQVSTYSSSFFELEQINPKMKAAIVALTNMKKDLDAVDTSKIDQLIHHLQQPLDKIAEKEVVREWHGLNFSGGGED
jgi:hypothetical protein